MSPKTKKPSKKQMKKARAMTKKGMSSGPMTKYKTC